MSGNISSKRAKPKQAGNIYQAGNERKQGCQSQIMFKGSEFPFVTKHKTKVHEFGFVRRKTSRFEITLRVVLYDSG